MILGLLEYLKDKLSSAGELELCTEERHEEEEEEETDAEMDQEESSQELAAQAPRKWLPVL